MRASDDPRGIASRTGLTVFIRGFAVSTVIGVDAPERGKPQTILMDLDIELAASAAGQSDSLADTVDYAAVVADLRDCLAGKRYYLLERLAQFAADRVLERFGAQRVAVTVAKAGILKDVGQVGVSLERYRVRDEP